MGLWRAVAGHWLQNSSFRNNLNKWRVKKYCLAFIYGAAREGKKIEHVSNGQFFF